jgi:TolB-like protein
LGVNFLLTGTLIKFQETFEVTARLIDPNNGAIIGAESVTTDDPDELRDKVETLVQFAG